MAALTSSNLSIAEAYLDYLWSRRNLYFLELLVAPDCKVRDSLFGESTEAEHVKMQICEMHEGFPDIAYTLEDVIANAGSQLAVRWSARGTHHGALLGIPATKRAVALSGVLLMRFAEARLTAITSVWEPCSMFQQLGLVQGSTKGSPLARIQLTKAASPYTGVAPGLLQKRRSTTSAPSADVDAQWGP
jgi:steroid delta-isomerase-like uncharacterized protein